MKKIWKSHKSGPKIKTMEVSQSGPKITKYGSPKNEKNLKVKQKWPKNEKKMEVTQYPLQKTNALVFAK